MFNLNCRYTVDYNNSFWAKCVKSLDSRRIHILAKRRQNKGKALNIQVLKT
jgi:hypothetical protein